MRILVICNYFDGGPDIEYSRWEVLEDEVVIEVPKPLQGYEYDLYHQDSRDTLEEIGVRLDYLNDHTMGELLRYLPYEKYCDIKGMHDQIQKYRDEMQELKDKYPDRWELEKIDPVLSEEVFGEIHELWEKAKDLEKHMIEKYANKCGYMCLGQENLHHIGIDEFCEMNHIDKVIEI